MVTVLEGSSNLSPILAHEARTLARHGAGPDLRLSCQCRVMDPALPVLITTGYW
jgi:ferredoxin